MQLQQVAHLSAKYRPAIQLLSWLGEWSGLVKLDSDPITRCDKPHLDVTLKQVDGAMSMRHLSSSVVFEMHGSMRQHNCYLTAT